LRLAGTEPIPGHPARLAAAELDPLVRLGPIIVELVCPVGVVDQLSLVVVERDVEVVRVHQLADDAMHRPVELLHVPSRARELGDAVERGLHVLALPMLRLGSFEFGQPAAHLGELRGEVGVRRHLVSRKRHGDPVHDHYCQVSPVARGSSRHGCGGLPDRRSANGIALLRLRAILLFE
jgi:hypothetical protein